MKIILTILISILTLVVFSQDTTYYDRDRNEVSSLKSSYYYEVADYDENDTNKVVETAYFKSGQIKHIKRYNLYSKKKQHGKRKEWHENGQLRMDIDYQDGKFHGELLTYWENGQLKRRDVYEMSDLIEGSVWDSEGKEVEYYDFMILPKFPDGQNGLVQYLRTNLKYPKKPKRKGITGRVLIGFVVERDGSVSNVYVVESVEKKLDKEAVKVVKRMPKWAPGMQDGVNIRVHYVLPIRFSMN